MQRIGESPEWDNIARLISNIRTLNANARQEGKVETRPLLDHSQLTGENLEEMGVIDRGAPRLTVKALEHCGRCDEGWIRIEDTRNCVKLCPYCEIPRRKAKRLNDLELPADALDMNLRRYEWDTPQQEQAVTRLLNHILNPQQPHSPSAFMWGSPGNGKTSLLYSVARWGCFKGKRVTFTSHTKLMNSIKDTWGEKNAKDPLRRWLDTCDVLLLDELGGLGGKGHHSTWYTTTTTEIIGAMYERWAGGKLSILMTSNLSPASVAKMFDRNAAIMSRLNAMFDAPIQMIGDDRRQRNSQELKAWGL
jgi:DNA replication protein DnaC